MNILSYDPGSRYIGIAYKINDMYITVELQSGAESAWMYIKMFNWDLVLCENFTAQHISSYGLATVKIIGGVLALCWDRNIPVKTQQNFERIMQKPRAKEMIIAAQGKMVRDHQQDALAHLLAWEKANEGSTTASS